VNRGALELLGYERAELLARPFDLICAGSSDEAVRAALRHAKAGIAAVEEVSLVRRDGSAVPVSFSSAEIRASQGPLQGYVCIAQDLSERKAIEEQVRSSLAEKELLLRELHHRVKNNMQVVSSLLAIQASYSADPQAAVELEESQRRIQSMALIHEQLHHSADLGRLDVRAYFESLASHLSRSFGSPSSIEIEVEISNLPLGIDQALVCGLIVNELVTNALKHAFNSRPVGRVGICLWDEADDTRVLEVWDDGPGIEAALDGEDRSLGLTLVATLAKQLAGRLAVVPGQGTRIRIEFPLEHCIGEVAI
jgi:PAS domain S-box-containing protein